MKIGDLVRSIHEDEVLIIITKEKQGYHIVYNSRLNVYWEMPKEHLEVI